MPQLARICGSILYLNYGKCRYKGDVSIGISYYYEDLKQEKSSILVDRVVLNSIKINGEDKNVTINYGEDLELELKFYSDFIFETPVLNIHIVDSSQQLIYQVNSKRDNISLNSLKVGENIYRSAQ